MRGERGEGRGERGEGRGERGEGRGERERERGEGRGRGERGEGRGERGEVRGERGVLTSQRWRFNGITLSIQSLLERVVSVCNVSSVNNRVRDDQRGVALVSLALPTSPYHLPSSPPTQSSLPSLLRLPTYFCFECSQRI